jgi:hypothetical protein
MIEKNNYPTFSALKKQAPASALISFRTAHKGDVPFSARHSSCKPSAALFSSPNETVFGPLCHGYDVLLVRLP